MKKEIDIEEIRSRIYCDDGGHSEISCVEMLARSIKQQEEMYSYIKKQSRNGLRVAVLLAALGIGILIVMTAFSGKYDKSMYMTAGLFVAILFEGLAGVALWAYRLSFFQLEKYFGVLQENRQFWSVVGLITKVADENSDTEKDLYLRIIDAEIRKRERTNLGLKE